MTFDISNANGLVNAAMVYRDSDRTDPLILILRTPGGVTHRFIIAEHGIEKQDCDVTGAGR